MMAPVLVPKDEIEALAERAASDALNLLEGAQRVEAFRPAAIKAQHAAKFLVRRLPTRNSLLIRKR
jgi:hypothetical protein